MRPLTVTQGQGLGIQYQSVLGCTKAYQSVLRFIKVYQSVLRCTKVYKSVPDYTEVYQAMEKMTLSGSLQTKLRSLTSAKGRG